MRRFSGCIHLLTHTYVCVSNARMHTTDRLGRRRHPAQQRGLRPLFPKLPQACSSRLIRIAMSDAAWQRLDGLVTASSAATKPRALGELLEGLLAGEAVSRETPRTAAIGSARVDTVAPFHGGAPDWQDWQIRKELALLAASTPRGAESRSASAWRN